MDIFEQYGVTVYRTTRGRGAYICDTDKGIRLVREFYGREEGLKKQAYITDELEKQGVHTDTFVRSAEGSIVVQDDDYKTYYMKKWFDGRECDAGSITEIIEAVQLLAGLHKVLLKIIPEEGTVNETKEIGLLFRKHIKELNGAKNYLKNKKRKNRFEGEVVESLDYFLEKALYADSLLKEKCSNLPERRICHGSFNHHNIIMCHKDCAAVNFSRAGIGYQVCDLYDFMRKMLEKHEWSMKLGMQMYEEYERARALTEEEKKLLCVLFIFPEKYWKIVNHYYNSNKAWFSDKDMEKLLKVRQQEENRNFFADRFAYNVALW